MAFAPGGRVVARCRGAGGSMHASSPTPRAAHPRRPLRRSKFLPVGVLAVALVSLAGLVTLSGDERRAPGLPLVRSWVTTADGRQPFNEQPPVAFGRPNPVSSSTLTIAVDPTEEYQTIHGFGASITDSSAAVLYRLDAQTRDATLGELFDPRDGAGLSYLRQPMGASDFIDETPYTYDDITPGASDYD